MGPVVCKMSSVYAYARDIALVDLTAMTSASFFAKGVDHCRAGEDAQRLPFDSLAP